MTDKFASDRYCNHLYLLPVVTFCFVPGCFIVTYAIAVAKDHVHPVLPMISETGEELPEGWVFAAIVNVGAFVGCLNYVARHFVLSRWMHVKPSMGERQRSKFGCLNNTSLTIAFLGVLGALIVANIEANDHLYLHNTGALLVVVMSIAYGYIHTYLSFLSPIVHWIKYARAAICVVTTAAFISGASAVPYAHAVDDQGLTGAEDDQSWQHNVSVAASIRFVGYRHVSENHPNFNALIYYHLTEWIIVVLYGLFLLSFVVEFRRCRIQVPKVLFSVVPSVSERSPDPDDIIKMEAAADSKDGSSGPSDAPTTGSPPSHAARFVAGHSRHLSNGSHIVVTEEGEVYVMAPQVQQHRRAHSNRSANSRTTADEERLIVEGLLKHTQPPAYHFDGAGDKPTSTARAT